MKNESAYAKVVEMIPLEIRERVSSRDIAEIVGCASTVIMQELTKKVLGKQLEKSFLDVLMDRARD